MILSRNIAGLGAAMLGAAVVQAQYTLDISYNTTNFFNEFDFFNSADPTNGFVKYVDGQTANNNGLAGFSNSAVYLGADFGAVAATPGRSSTRVVSKKAFTRGLIIADVAHMPGSTCGSWPALWTVGGDWPNNGEIDIVEGVNTQRSNIMTLHSSEGCNMGSVGALGTSKLLNENCQGNQGCGQETDDQASYGDGFNLGGGGIYAMEWTSDAISVWFFPRAGVPADLALGSTAAPDPSTWGQPRARFAGGTNCNIDEHFAEHNIVINLTFCGDWAASVWDNDPTCKALAATCEDFVANNPAAFTEAYWLINKIDVYNQAGYATAAAPPPPAAKRDLDGDGVVPVPFLA